MKISLHFFHSISLNINKFSVQKFQTQRKLDRNRLQRRLFKLQLEDRESAEHTDLVLHTDVRWLSRGKFLDRFQELLPEITAFLDERGDDTQMFKNKKWLTDLAFLTDITMHFNTINLELQGKGKTIIEMINSVNAFKR
ncbi:hypothetical protein HHI36_021423 [Cryptolaemus montrouzieri]|uniref:Zinc finger BED domain-containing protein 5 n=1 Tax=Cryptolaemus montrouzieri TaxID=559131 RepID=A0ABD2MX16_9CUCU